MDAAIVPWERIRHVLLDMDGTVLDLAFDNHFWTELVPARYAQARGIEVDAAYSELRPHFEGLRGRLEWYCLEFWSRLTSLDLVHLKREVAHRIEPLPGAAGFLRDVRGGNRQLWLVTNAHPHSVEIKMRQTGLGDHFDRIVSSHELGAPKEDQRFWCDLMRRYPFDPVATLFVDDSLPVLQAARDYGIRHCVAIRRPDSGGPPRDVGGFPSVERLADLAPPSRVRNVGDQSLA